MDVILFDMGSLEYRLDGGVLHVSAPHVGLLGKIAVAEDLSQREAVFRALDDVLASLELPAADGSWYRAALYNPTTFQIALGAIPATEVYGDGRPVPVHPFGSLLTLRTFDGSEHLELGGRVLPKCSPTARNTQMALASH